MNPLSRKLQKSGIHPYGSNELQLYEERLTRYFTQEYRREADKKHTLAAFGITTDQGATWEETDELMSVHYDQPLEFFQSFLDRDYMAYSMAYYGETPHQVLRSSATLEQAQEEKFRLICERAEIRGNERILNIGCGFGSFEAYLFKHFPNVEVVTITASKTQADYIRNKQQDGDHLFSKANLTLIENDISNIPPEELGLAAYDLVISIAVFEQVNNLDAIFNLMASLLKPGGRVFLHLIVSQPVFPQYFNARKTPVGAYFPGGRVWPHQEMLNQHRHLTPELGVYINGMNYWRTIDEWHRRFWEQIEQLHESLLSEEDIRYWNNYFSVCKVVLFAPQSGEFFGNGHYLYRKQ
ncbi:SAM-dependent methyltransferase [Sedimenticola sp.]|uniref:SAM-dependent methyltransferase n=1 Tax=Sedimenticola sp. TaxID=1940285 RepID=UPI00258E89A1|nr:class I SAM-dependent methyltransferase [Sedimenticola sp.]MCW8903174.1 class I SAM-dependent methyltransferase [Sedimenticola sp.]